MSQSTSNRRSPRHAAAAVALVLALAVLTGCSWPGGSSRGDAGDTGAGQSRPHADTSAPAETAPAAELLGRDVIQRAALRLHARDVGAARDRVRVIVADAQGVIADERTRSGRRGDARRSTLTLRVPAAAFETVVRDLARLGRLASQRVTSEDVSTQVVDVEARVLSAERTLRRIRELLQAADDFSDVLSLESELARREAELASLKAQQAYLEDQTALSTITLTLLPPEPRQVGTDGEPAGFVGGLTVGWDALVTLLSVLLTALGVLVPLLLLVVPVALVAWWAVRRAVDRRPAQPPAA